MAGRASEETAHGHESLGSAIAMQPRAGRARGASVKAALPPRACTTNRCAGTVYSRRMSASLVLPSMYARNGRPLVSSHMRHPVARASATVTCLSRLSLSLSRIFRLSLQLPASVGQYTHTHTMLRTDSEVRLHLLVWRLGSLGRRHLRLEGRHRRVVGASWRGRRLCHVMHGAWRG